MIRFSKAIVIFGALSIWYALFGFLIAPLLVRYFGERYLQQNFSPESSIQQVSINPFKAAIRVEGLFVADQAGSWSIAWRQAELNANAASLIKFYPVVDAVRLDGAEITYQRQAAEGKAADTSETEQAVDWREQVERLKLAEIPQLRVDLLEVSEGRLKFSDPAAGEGFVKTIDPINFTLRDLTTEVDPGRETVMRFQALTEEGGRLSWEGVFNSQPIRSSGTFSLSGLAVHALSPYFKELIRFELERAVYAISFDYELDFSDLDHLLEIQDGQMALTELLCQPMGEAEPFISVDSILVDAIDFRFPAMDLKIAEISVSDGATRVSRNTEGQINLLNLFAIPPAAAPAQVAPEPDAAGTDSSLAEISYQVAAVSLSDYRISWQDALGVGQANVIVDIPHMQLSGVSSDSDAPVEIEADYVVGEAGTASLSGSVVPSGPALDLSLKIEMLPLELLSPYAEEFGATSISAGRFDFNGRLQYAPAGTQTLTGEISARDVSLANDERLSADWALLGVQGMRVGFAPFSLVMDSLSLESPVVGFTQAPSEDTGAQLATPKRDPAEEKVPADSGLPIRIDSLRLSDGRFVFKDARTVPPSEIVMDALGLEVSGLDLAGGRTAEIGLSTGLNGSRLTVGGTTDASRFKEATQLRVSLEGLALPAFSPYSGQAVGRRIASGQFNLESNWQIEAGQLRATNKMRIESFKLGDRVESEQATRLPLDLAVILLQGPNGVMDLSLPLSGDLNDPKMRLGQIIRTAIVGLITNVASSPFKMLSGLVGGEEDLSLVRFETGSSALSSAMISRLNTLAAALKKRPGIQLFMTPKISEADLVWLSEKALRADLMDGAEIGDERIFRKRLRQRYREKMQAAGTPDRETTAEDADGLARMVAALLPDVVLTDAERGALASARAQAIREHLVVAQGIAAERLVEGESEIRTPASTVVFELE